MRCIGRLTHSNLIVGLGIVASVALLALGVPGDLMARDEWKDRFLREAPSAWDQVRRFLRTLQGTCDVFTSVQREGKTTKNAERFAFKQNGDCCLFYAHPTTNDDAETVSCQNTKYTFRIWKGRKVDDWFVEDLMVFTTSKDFHRVDKTRSLDCPRPVVDLHLMAGISLNYIQPYAFPRVFNVASPAFEIKSGELGTLDGNRAVKIRFAYDPQRKRGTNRVRIIDGMIWVSPDDKWVIRHAEFRLQRIRGTSAVHVQLSYDKANGYPIPKRLICTENSPVKNLTVVREWHYNLAPGAPAESDFTLTAFGLPEPPGVDWTPPTPWYVYAGAAGIILFALCFGFGVWKQRLKARRSTVTD